MFWSKKNDLKTGQLSSVNIIKELNCDDGIKIFSAYDIYQNIRSASFDITPTIIAMSVKTGMLQTVYVKKSQCINSYYIYVRPKDTVLIVSNEFLIMPNYIAGYVTSRLSNVVNGFGHISTTIDPNWKGALLIGLSNPSTRTIKIEVGTSTISQQNGLINNIVDKKTLATITFHYLSTPTVLINNNSYSMRTDLLKKVKYDQRKDFKTLMYKIINYKQRKFTDYFFEYLVINENNMKTEQGWNNFLEEFSIFNNSLKSQNIKEGVSGFIITENIFNRGRYFLENHKSTLTFLLIIVCFFLLKIGVITNDIISTVFEAIGLL